VKLEEAPEAGSELVMVFVSGNWTEANAVACALRGHEIPAFVIDDNVCRIYSPAAFIVGGAKVIIPVRDLEGATDVLRPGFNGDPPFVGEILTVPMSLLAAFFIMLQRWSRRKPTEPPSQEKLTGPGRLRPALEPPLDVNASPGRAGSLAPATRAWFWRRALPPKNSFRYGGTTGGIVGSGGPPIAL
jgi:hypothetical protein